MSKSNVHVFNLSEYKSPEIVEDRSKEWVTYGKDDKHYDYLIDNYNYSTTNKTLINAISKMIYGKGLGVIRASLKPMEYAQIMSILPKKDVKQECFDFYGFGGTMLQILYTEDRKNVAKILHSPVNLWRPAKCNEKGEITDYFYSDNWNNTKDFTPKSYPVFGTSNSEIEVMYVHSYAPNIKYFGSISYGAGLPYAVLEREIADYLINDVQNGFSGTKVVNFNNGVPSEEEREVQSRQVREKLTGSKGQKVIISFNDNKETQTDVTDIPLNDAPEHYQYLSEECQRKLLLAHNVTSPLIFGIASTNGFSSNADELKNSYVLFDNMVIRPLQQELIDAYQTILAYNGISSELFFRTLQPLEFTDLENVTNTEEQQKETGVQMSSQSWIDNYGEELTSDYVLIDDHDAIDLEEEDVQRINLSFMDKVINFVSTGTANPKAKSEQDKQIKDAKFITRYRYTGKLTEDTRPFCKAMLSANKLYRKEDIIRMSQDPTVNPKWGPEGADTYDIFKFKGGGNCHHVWRREVYASMQGNGIDPTSPNARQLATSIAEKRGYKVRNPYQVNVQPKNLPYEGFLPTNKRFQ